MGDNATDEMKRLSVVEVEASRIQSSLLYVTRLLIATMRSQAIASDCKRMHAIACDLEKKTLCRQLSEFLKMHREREVGQKVCESVSSRQL